MSQTGSERVAQIVEPELLDFRLRESFFKGFLQSINIHSSPRRMGENKVLIYRPHFRSHRFPSPENLQGSFGQRDGSSLPRLFAEDCHHLFGNINVFPLKRENLFPSASGLDRKGDDLFQPLGRNGKEFFLLRIFPLILF